MIKSKPINNIDQIRKLLDYNSDTGIFTWKVNLPGPAKAGMVAGARHNRGYIMITAYKTSYLAHRLAWAMHYGNIPDEMQIDHINGKRDDNRIVNLRLANHNENCRNSKIRKHSKTGVKGVKKRGTKYHVRIVINSVEHWVGSYNTLDEAGKAYENAALKNFGEFAKIKATPE